MGVVIASELLAQIVAEAERSPGVEVCGLLLGHEPNPPPPGGGGAEGDGGGGHGTPVSHPPPPSGFACHLPLAGEDRIDRRHPGLIVDSVLPCANVASDPARRFEIDPAALLAAHRAARNGGPAIVGHYHSHPLGDPTPSPCDAADAAPDGSIWLITARSEVRAFRAVEGGALHDRFDPVALLVEG